MDPRGQYFWPSITNMLSQNILVLNSRRNFNDPFDSQPIIDNDLSNSAIRDYFRNMLEEPFHPRRSLAGAFRILELKTSGKTNLNKKHVENIKAGLHKSANEILDLAGHTIVFPYCGKSAPMGVITQLRFPAFVQSFAAVNL
jgi:hypothetical protein